MGEEMSRLRGQMLRLGEQRCGGWVGRDVKIG